MNKHELTACPSCGKLFECKMGSYYVCHCSDIQLSKEQAEYMEEKWDDCLCHQCLRHITEDWSEISKRER